MKNSLDTITSKESSLAKIYSPEKLKNVAESYGFSELKILGGPDRGISSHNTIVESEDGTLFFLKEYKQNDAERRGNSSYIEYYLAEHSVVPVVTPLKSDASDFSVYIDDKMYALFPYVKHNTEGPTSSKEEITLIYNLAETLGRIHATPIKEGFVANQIDRWEPRNIEERTGNLRKVQLLIESKESLDQFDILSQKIIERKIEMLQQMDSLEDFVVDRTICHGDYHGHNVLFDDNFNIIGVCDWDIAGLSDSHIDFLNSFMMQVVGYRYNDYKTERKEEAKAFVSGYLSGSGNLNKKKLEAAVSTLGQVIIGTTWPMYDHYIQKHTKADNRLEDTLTKAEFYFEQRQEIVNFISEALEEAG